MRLPRFHLKTLMVAVGIIAALLACLRGDISWWAVKPALYLVFIPLVSATLAARSPPRPLIVLVIAINALLLLAWYELRRPTEGFLVGHEDIEYVLDSMQYWRNSTPDLRIRRAFGRVVRRGTMPDLLCLIGSIVALVAMRARSVSLRLKIFSAMSLTLLSIYGWATSKRWGGTDDYQEWLTHRYWEDGDKTPIHLAQRWLHEREGFPTLWRAIGTVRALELAMIAIVFVSLTTVALHAFRQRKV